MLHLISALAATSVATEMVGSFFSPAQRSPETSLVYEKFTPLDYPTVAGHYVIMQHVQTVADLLEIRTSTTLSIPTTMVTAEPRIVEPMPVQTAMVTLPEESEKNGQSEVEELAVSAGPISISKDSVTALLVTTGSVPSLLFATAQYQAATGTFEPYTTDPTEASFSLPTSLFQGRAASYNPGKGSCGWENTYDDYVCAISKRVYDSQMDGSVSAYCGKSLLITTAEGHSARVKVVDSCGSCDERTVDLSPVAFKALAPASGFVDVEWSWIAA